MEWLSQNWVWVLFSVAFVAMHMFGHGGHGGHGSRTNDPKLAGAQSEPRTPEQTPGHRH